ncbi:MAG: methyltransferase domain-containing protein [Candidatus Aenigmarchaeota archaeon]|nr:methyltransferase domain-containing protein [Candidatus Aenigmarchaeota archaeon]
MVQDKKTAKELYDSTAGRYDLRQDNPSTKHLRREEEHTLRKFAHGTVIDIGCGTGQHLPLLEEVGVTPIGIDISLPMLHQSRKKCGCSLLRADAESLPFKSASIDTIVCLHSVLNICDYEKIISEAGRILKKGGIFLFSATSIWDKEYPPVRKKILYQQASTTKTIRLEGRKISFRLFSKNEITNILKSAGFRQIYFKGLFVYQRPYWGRFEDFTMWQKLKLMLDLAGPGSLGTMYAAAFKKE